MAGAEEVEVVVAHHDCATPALPGSLLAARWLIEHGFDPSSPGCEFDVLRSQR